MSAPLQPSADRRPIGRYISIGVGLAVALIGYLIDLYTNEAKDLVESGWIRHVIRLGLLAGLLAAASGLTWIISGRMWQRQRARQLVAVKSLEIHAEDFEDDLPNDEVVIGRRLWYVERETSSPKLVVFLHGLGLDANDFRRYAQLSEAHCVAFTLFGFNSEEAHNDRYGPIGLKTHADLLSGAINNTQRQYPQKDLVLVGFSLGADMLLRLADLWREHPDRAPKIAAALLLDPNINSSTMKISTAVAEMDTSDPISELKRLVQSTSSLAEFQNICEYMYKTTAKNLNQIRRHARDFVEYWKNAQGYELFLQRVVGLSTLANPIRVVFSFHYGQDFNGLVAAARSKGISRQMFEATSLDHFELISDESLTEELAALDEMRTAERT